jgi:hypothetical protein
LTHVLLDDVLTIKSRNVTLNQLETIQLILGSLTSFLDILEALIWEYFIDRFLLVSRLRFDIEVHVYQKLAAYFSHSFDFALDCNTPESL